MRILVVEDDAVMRDIFSVMLRRADFEVRTAEDGKDAVDFWEKEEYDLVLMDVQMPRMNGFETTAIIREKERTRGGHTPIVAVTAFALDKDEKECLAAGMDAYISKPIDFRKCIELIHDIIGQQDRRCSALRLAKEENHEDTDS